jgi:hypothetical protein
LSVVVVVVLGWLKEGVHDVDTPPMPFDNAKESTDR